jgi:hypothetical protein
MKPFLFPKGGRKVSLPLEFRGWGRVGATSSAPDGTLNFDNVIDGAAPEAGDFVIWHCAGQDSGTVQVVASPGVSYVQFRTMNPDSGHKTNSLYSAALAQADIDTPPSPLTNTDSYYHFTWIAYKMNGIAYASQADNADWRAGNPNRITVDASAQDAPILENIFADLHGGTSISWTENSLDGLDDTLDTGLLSQSNGRMRIWTRPVQRGQGSLVAFNQNDNGTYNSGCVSYFRFA